MPIRLRTAALALSGLALLASACGGSDSDADPAAATTAAAVTTTAVTTTAVTTTVRAEGSSSDLCDERAALRSSVEEIGDVDVIKNGTSALTGPVADIREDLADVRAEAGSELAPQVDALDDALGDLEQAITQRDAAGLAAVVTAASAMLPAATDLLSGLDELTC